MAFNIFRMYSIITTITMITTQVDAIKAPATFPFNILPIGSPAPTTQAPTFSTAPTLSLPKCSTAPSTCKFNSNIKCSKHCSTEHAGNGMYCGKNILTSDTSQLAEVCCQCDTIKTTKITLKVALPRCTAGNVLHALGSDTPLCVTPNNISCQDRCGPHKSDGFFCNSKTGKVTTFQLDPCCQCGEYDNIRVIKG
jgi:hypothetical protein